jgi:DNA-binding transcriptional LysR family regulator
MDFEQLRIFMILAEEGTYLGAANRIATSRSRVRRKLDQLESEAGTKLIYRDQGILRLTPAGEVLVRRGRDLLDQADHLISHIHEIGTKPTGCLKIAMPTGPPTADWNGIRQSLQDRFPDLRIELLFDPNPTQRLPREAEIAITYEETLPQGCGAIELGEYRMRLFVSAGYLATHGSPESVHDLESHRVAVWRSPNHESARLLLRDGRSVLLDPLFVTDDPALLFRMAIAGEFICCLPELPHLIDPSLKTLFDDEIAGVVRERLVIPDILADLPRIRELVELTQNRSGLRPH